MIKRQPSWQPLDMAGRFMSVRQSLTAANDCAPQDVQALFCRHRHQARRPLPCFQAKDWLSARSMMLLLQRRNALAQFVYGIVEMTDCILEALLEPINSIIQAFIDAFTGRRCRSIWHDWLSGVRSRSFAV